MPARVGKRRPGVLNPPGTKSVYCFYTLQRGYSHPCDTCSGGALDRDTGTPYTVEFNRKQCCPKCYNLAVYQMSFNLAMVCRCEACEPLNDFLEGLPTGARMAGEAMPIPEQRSTTTTADKHKDKQEKETQLLKATAPQQRAASLTPISKQTSTTLTPAASSAVADAGETASTISTAASSTKPSPDEELQRAYVCILKLKKSAETRIHPNDKSRTPYTFREFTEHYYDVLAAIEFWLDAAPR